MADNVDIGNLKERAGGYAVLAKALGLSRATVWGWSRIPAERVLEVERITGIPRTELRPDLYPDDSAPTPTSGEGGK